MFMLTLLIFSLLPALFFGCVDPRCTKYLMILPTFNSCVASLLIDSISSPCFVFEVAHFFIPRWLLLTNLSVPTLWQLHLACLWMITICLLLMAVSSSNSFISCYCNFFNSSMISCHAMDRYKCLHLAQLLNDDRHLCQQNYLDEIQFWCHVWRSLSLWYNNCCWNVMSPYGKLWLWTEG